MGVDCVANHPRFGGANKKNLKKDCEYRGRNKGKDPGQASHCVNCYFVALLMFLSFQLGPNSEIATFVGHAPLILQCQGTSYP